MVYWFSKPLPLSRSTLWCLYSHLVCHSWRLSAAKWNAETSYGKHLHFWSTEIYHLTWPELVAIVLKQNWNWVKVSLVILYQHHNSIEIRILFKNKWHDITLIWTLLGQSECQFWEIFWGFEGSVASSFIDVLLSCKYMLVIFCAWILQNRITTIYLRSKIRPTLK